MKLRSAKFPYYDYHSKKLKTWKLHQLLSFIRGPRLIVISTATHTTSQLKLSWTLSEEIQDRLVLISEG